VVQTHLSEAIKSRFPNLGPVAMLAFALTLVMALAMTALTGTVAAATNTTDANTLYYGITILEWAVIVLAFLLLALFGWLRNIYLFFGFIFLVIVVLIVHFFGA